MEWYTSSESLHNPRVVFADRIRIPLTRPSLFCWEAIWFESNARGPFQAVSDLWYRKEQDPSFEVLEFVRLSWTSCEWVLENLCWISLRVRVNIRKSELKFVWLSFFYFHMDLLRVIDGRWILEWFMKRISYAEAQTTNLLELIIACNCSSAETRFGKFREAEGGLQ